MTFPNCFSSSKLCVMKAGGGGGGGGCDEESQDSGFDVPYGKFSSRCSPLKAKCLRYCTVH